MSNGSEKALDKATQERLEESKVMKNLYCVMIMTVPWGLVWADMPIPYWVAIILTIVGLVVSLIGKVRTTEDNLYLVVNLCLTVCLICMGLKFSSPIADSFPGIALVIISLVCIVIALATTLFKKTKAPAADSK